MSPGFHDQPFDESTLTKLGIFETYAAEWIPVFVASPQPPITSLHIYDFMAGPGTDSAGTPGSPLRLLEQLRKYRQMAGWERVYVHLHLFDSKQKSIRTLKDTLATQDTRGISVHAECCEFQEAFSEARPVLESPHAAKLVLIDQYGVSAVTDDVFKALAAAPKCDMLFFVASSALNRFREHPNIKVKIDELDDPRRVHVEAMEYYRRLLAARSEYFLGRFSLKKVSGNIYGIVFGSAHPKGIDKFLTVAWKHDEWSGEANFDINRDRGSLFGSDKIHAFEEDLEQRILGGHTPSERDIVRVCFEHGVLRAHSESVIKKLKNDGSISCDFRVPQLKTTRAVTLLRPRP